MSEATRFGQFVWYELMVPDTEAAIKFYGDVVGWSTQVFDGPGAEEMGYRMWVGSDGPLGGVLRLPPNLVEMGVPPNWTCNVTVRDLDATLEKVKSLGGQVMNGPEAMPGVGRFAVILDPQGAAIVCFTPENTMSAPDNKPGHFGWSELVADDHNAAFNFYAQIFGWEKLQTMDMGEMGEYLLFGYDGKQVGGMMTKPKGGEMPSFWLYYIQVKDFDAALERAQAAGAKICNGPMPVPGGARIVQLLDPQGAMTALLG